MNQPERFAVQAYEALRAQVLTGNHTGQACGLASVLRYGVATWLAERSTSTCPVKPPRQTRQPPETPVVIDETRAAVVQVLVAMTLAHSEEIHG